MFRCGRLLVKYLSLSCANRTKFVFLIIHLTLNGSFGINKLFKHVCVNAAPAPCPDSRPWPVWAGLMLLYRAVVLTLVRGLSRQV